MGFSFSKLMAEQNLHLPNKLPLDELWVAVDVHGEFKLTVAIHVDANP